MNVLLKSYDLEQRTDGTYWMNYTVVAGSKTEYFPGQLAIAIQHEDPIGITDTQNYSVELVVQNEVIDVTFVEQIGGTSIAQPLNVANGGPKILIRHI